MISLMPRAPRIEYEGAVYNVMARGAKREDIVFADQDRATFVRTRASYLLKVPPRSQTQSGGGLGDLRT